MTSNKKLLNVLYRKSKNTDDIISVFTQATMPLAADAVYEKLKKKNSKIALSTVYRNIEKLMNLKIIQTIISDGEKALYELIRNENTHRHYLVCTNCKKITSIKFCPFESVEQNITQETGFEITGHKFEIYGLCPNCKTK